MIYLIAGYTGFLGSALRDAILAASSEDGIFAVCRIRHQGQMTFRKCKNSTLILNIDKQEYIKIL